MFTTYCWKVSTITCTLIKSSIWLRWLMKHHWKLPTLSIVGRWQSAPESKNPQKDCKLCWTIRIILNLIWCCTIIQWGHVSWDFCISSITRRWSATRHTTIHRTQRKWWGAITISATFLFVRRNMTVIWISGKGRSIYIYMQWIISELGLVGRH